LRVNAQTLYLDKQKTPQICKTLPAMAVGRKDMTILNMRFIFTFLAILTTTKLICQDNDLLKYQGIINNHLKSWTSTFSNFKLTDFKLLNSKPFESNYKHDLKDLNSFYTIYKPVLTFSADSTAFLDIYSYQLNLEKKNGRIIASPDIDQAIMLYDKKSSYWDRICFGSASFHYDEAIWLDDQKFILLAVENSEKNYWTPHIFIGDIKTHKLFFYTNKNSSCVQKTTGYKSDKLSRLKIDGL
jgi:hypothetical protein